MQKLLTETELYELLLKEEWPKLVDFLYYNKEAIKKDYHLTHIAGLVESEFIRKLDTYPADREDTLIVLENFYLLNDGDFYNLKPKSIETVYEELALRNPKQYSHFSKGNREKRTKDQAESPPILAKIHEQRSLPHKWIEIYNRLFEVMDVRGDAETYFSGPRFINLVRKFDRYHPDYNQYIRERERLNQSTSRKVFFEEILMELSNIDRKNVIDNVLSIVRPYDKERIDEIEVLLYGESFSEPTDIEEDNRKVIVFISYSWDDEEHKKWVLSLANRLVKDGLEIKIDKQLMRLGASAPYTMEQAIENADKVLVIFTPGYKLKADERKGGVGYEYSIMNAKLYNNQTINKKIIPVLRVGTKEQSIPTFMQQYIHVDLRNDECFENNYNDLKHDLLTPDA